MFLSRLSSSPCFADQYLYLDLHFGTYGCVGFRHFCFSRTENTHCSPRPNRQRRKLGTVDPVLNYRPRKLCRHPFPCRCYVTFSSSSKWAFSVERAPKEMLKSICNRPMDRALLQSDHRYSRATRTAPLLSHLHYQMLRCLRHPIQSLIRQLIFEVSMPSGIDQDMFTIKRSGINWPTLMLT